MSSAGESKRLDPRLSKDFPLRYQVRGDKESFNAVSSNISSGGLSFTVHRFIPPETSVMLELNLPLRTVNSAAEIAWITPIAHSDRYRLGAKFLEVNLRDKQYLADYVDTHLKRF